MRRKKDMAPNDWERFHHELSELNFLQDLMPNPESWSNIQMENSASKLKLNRVDTFENETTLETPHI